MYVRLKMPVFKTLISRGLMNMEVLGKLTTKVSSTQKHDEIVLTITNSKTNIVTEPMKKRMSRWFQHAPVVTRFSITETFVRSLDELGLVRTADLEAAFIISKEVIEPPLGSSWWPFTVWYFWPPQA
jgi:hypothetical protein